MPSDRHKEIPADSLLQLRQRLDHLPRKSPERTKQVAAIAELYGVSPTTVYRALKQLLKPRAVHRADHGKPRLLPKPELERYCELVAALKLRTPIRTAGTYPPSAPSSCWKTTASRPRRGW